MKTLKLSLATLLLASLTSCATTSYIGDNLPPTQKIDVFYAARDVKRQYRVMGHLSASNVTSNENDAKAKLIERAKAVGADGVIILGIEYTGGKDSTPFEKADAIKYID